MVLPSRVSSRGASGLRVIFGAKPTGFRVTLFWCAPTGSSFSQVNEACASTIPLAEPARPLTLALSPSGGRGKRLAALGRVGAPADGDQTLLLVVNVHVDQRPRASRPPHARGAREERAHGGLEIVDAEVDGGHAASHRHAHREVADDVDEGRDGPPVKLRGAQTPLELRPHGHGHGQGARVVIESDRPELKEAQKRRGVEGRLHLIDAQALRGGLGHGRTTTLPNTSRSSSSRKASFTSSRGSSRSITGMSRPCWMSAM